jgi:hypothetical protein
MGQLRVDPQRRRRAPQRALSAADFLPDSPRPRTQDQGTMSGVRAVRVVIVAVIAMASVACSGVPAGSGGLASSAPTSTVFSTSDPTPGVVFRALDLPADYSRGTAEAVDGTTAVGWVQDSLNDEQPAVWDTTTGALRVLAVPAKFVHPSGETFVRLVGVSGTTAVGTGILGAEKRGQSRSMAWNIETGDLRILDIPADFTQAEAHAVSGTTAVGQVWTAHGEVGAPVAWDTETGAVRILKMPAGYDCGNPLAVSGDTIVGIRCDVDEALPLVWNPLTADARDLDLLPATQDGVPRAVDGTTAVGNCCFGEEGTPLPLIWDTGTGSVRQLDLPAPFIYGRAVGVSGSVVIGIADFKPLLWDLGTGQVSVLPAPAGYDEQYGTTAVNGRTLVGSACPPPPSTSENPRCVAAAWTLP